MKTRRKHVSEGNATAHLLIEITWNGRLDPVAKIPEYKVCAVRVERVAVAG